MIKNKVTDYGEEYNRESMYETARERFFDGKKVKMGGSRHKSLISIMIKDLEMELANRRVKSSIFFIYINIF